MSKTRGKKITQINLSNPKEIQEMMIANIRIYYDKDNPKKYRNEVRSPIEIYNIDDMYIVAAYQGNKKENVLDIIVKYRQKFNPSVNDWTNIRTPGHTHWMVDMLVKRYKNRIELRNFLQKVILIWDKLEAFQNPDDRIRKLQNMETLYKKHIDEDTYKVIKDYGFYTLKFIFHIIVLLMYQEKTNYPKGTIFQGILAALEADNDDLFSIFSNL